MESANGEVDIAILVQERDELKEHCFRLNSEVTEHCEHITRLTADLTRLTANLRFAPGHFYSPIVDVSDPVVIQAARAPRPICDEGGITLVREAMEAFCERLARHHALFPFGRDPQPGFRFFYGNPAFGAHDAVALFSMLLEYRPRRVVEVGSGYSSCLLLDTNERFFDGKLELTMIDPALEEIQTKMPFGDTAGAELIPEKVQEVPLSVFRKLDANDILFLDSSHVAKTASDVNHYLFEILPVIAPGVLVHIHDIVYPFEYPAEWILEEKRSWNEAYAVRAFLQYNLEFPIVYWTNYAAQAFPDKVRALMPMAMENEGGSMWLQRRNPGA